MTRSAWIFASATAALLVPPVARAAPADSIPAVATAPADGVERLKSAFGFDETLTRLKADVATKGIRFFDAIDQAELGAGANIKTRRSTLVLFGNPPLGVQFLTSNPLAGLDWPVRMLVVEDADGAVWVAWSDFDWIGKRYRIGDRAAQLKMASDVAASIAGAATH